jgi:cobalt/nickel transport system permease protein
MRDQLLLILYFMGAIAVTLIHEIPLLLAGIGIAYLLAWRDGLAVAGRVIPAIALFNLVLTVSYAGIASARGTFSLEYIGLMNLRVFLLTSLSVLAIRRINLFRAVAFSRTLQFVLILAYGQILLFRRLYTDSRMAFMSRSIRTPALRNLYRHAAANASFFADRALHRAGELTDALRSRGYFHDSA